jgi:hypothetical protein
MEQNWSTHEYWRQTKSTKKVCNGYDEKEYTMYVTLYIENQFHSAIEKSAAHYKDSGCRCERCEKVRLSIRESIKRCEKVERWLQHHE